MKHYTRASLLLASLCIFLPSLSFAKEIVGISEKTFEQFQSLNCSPYEGQGRVLVGSRYCDPLIAQLHDKILMRVEARGEQYWIQTTEEGVSILNRYMPNGMYRVNNALYWIQDGYRVRLPKGKTFKTILQVASKKGAPITSINNADFDRMLRSCEYYGDKNPATDSNYQSCIAEQAIGTATHTKLARSIVLKTQDHGKLFYVPAGNDSNPIQLAKRVNMNGAEISLHAYLLSQAQHIQPEILSGMLVK